MVNKDQAFLIFQTILAQHADKTWGEICEMLGLVAIDDDKNIKMKDSYNRQLYECGFCIDSKQAIDFLFRFDEYDIEQFICYCQAENNVRYVSIGLEKLFSIISFEDKV